MVLGKAFPKRRRLGDHVVVIARLRPEECRFQRPRIANAMRPALAFDLIILNGQNIGHSEVIGHFGCLL
jgi:hypothetical protein